MITRAQILRLMADLEEEVANTRETVKSMNNDTVTQAYHTGGIAATESIIVRLAKLYKHSHESITQP